MPRCARRSDPGAVGAGGPLRADRGRAPLRARTAGLRVARGAGRGALRVRRRAGGGGRGGGPLPRARRRGAAVNARRGGERDPPRSARTRLDASRVLRDRLPVVIVVLAAAPCARSRAGGSTPW